MKIVIFGLTISSSWGNGHATLWRGLVRELSRRGHYIVFFERDVPYYAIHRDLYAIEGGELVLYSELDGVLPQADRHLADADVAIITSYCSDAIMWTDCVLSSACGRRIFYDMDTPVTLEQLRAGNSVPYIGPEGLGGFDVVLSFTGGLALSETRRLLGAKYVVPLYGSVDPDLHRPVPPDAESACDLSYLGTYSSDRQDLVQQFFLDPAARLPNKKFVLGGSLYPRDFPWLPNVFYLGHVPPAQHPRFYCSSRLTLSVTRGPMARMGYCPSGRLFEAAACGTPVVSDTWNGIEEFFAPGDEILLVKTTDEVQRAIAVSDAELSRISRRARERVLSSHTAVQRATELENIMNSSLFQAVNLSGN